MCTGSASFHQLLAQNEVPQNVARFYKYLCSQSAFSAVKLPKVEVKVKPEVSLWQGSI